MSETHKTAREEYHARIQQRQTVIFGSIGGIMVLLLLVSYLIWTGIIPAPYNPQFSGSEVSGSELVTPCVSDDTQAVDMTTIAVNVYNSSSRNGLAGNVGQQLSNLGVALVGTANWSDQAIAEPARIITGKDGIPAAYTLAQYMPGAIVLYDPDVKDEVLSVVLGKDFTEVSSPAEVAQANPGGLLESQEGCTVIGKGKAG